MGHIENTDACLVCESREIERIAPIYSRYQREFKMHVGICRRCGHMQINPLPSEQEIQYFNDAFLGTKYAPSETLSSNQQVKLDLLKGRIDGFVLPGTKVLDVGAGEGWAMPYFQSKGCEYFAIEAIDVLRDSLEKRGATVVSASIYDDLHEYAGQFDLIIFRHILEHLVKPKVALDRLRSFLKEDGLCYIALPNGALPELSKGYVTSFLRPVHISYFHPGNIRRLVLLSGFEVQFLGEEREIYTMLRKSDARVEPGESVNHFNEMSNIVSRSKKTAKTRDILNLIKIWLYRIRHAIG